MFKQYMYLKVNASLIGIFVLVMVVKEIIVEVTCILSSPALAKVSQQMYLNT